jgi:hypothetical protein
MPYEILHSVLRDNRIVFECANAVVTCLAEKVTYSARGVIVIDMSRLISVEVVQADRLVVRAT